MKKNEIEINQKIKSINTYLCNNTVDTIIIYEFRKNFCYSEYRLLLLDKMYSDIKYCKFNNVIEITSKSNLKNLNIFLSGFLIAIKTLRYNLNIIKKLKNNFTIK